MRKNNTQSITQILSEYIEKMNIAQKLKEVDAIHACEKIFGKTFSSYIDSIKIRNRILYLNINSSVVKSELILMHEELKKRINEEAGANIIEKIIFR